MFIECYQCSSTYDTSLSTAYETEVFCCSSCEKEYGPLEVIDGILALNQTK